MYQKAEHNVWKPVLGALSLASLFLSLVGNLLFSPGNQSKEGGTATNTLAAKSVPQSLDSPRVESDSQPGPVLAEAARPPSIGQPKLADSKPEPQKEPVVSQAEPAPVAELKPQAELPAQTVVALTPQSSIAPPESVVPGEKALPDAPPTDTSVAEVRTEAKSPQPNDVRAQDEPTTAAADPSPPFVAQKLSHRDRKALRKVAHLEKKKKRLVENGRPIVWR